MRIGKIEHKVLRVLYEKGTRVQKGEIYRYNGLRVRQIIEKIIKIKYPKEKNYGITFDKKIEHGFSCFNLIKEGKKINDSFTKTMNTINSKINQFHKKTTTIYRAIKTLQNKKMIEKIRQGNTRKGCNNYYQLTELGKRVISHRI